MGNQETYWVLWYRSKLSPTKGSQVEKQVIKARGTTKEDAQPVVDYFLRVKMADPSTKFVGLHPHCFSYEEMEKEQASEASAALASQRSDKKPSAAQGAA